MRMSNLAPKVRVALSRTFGELEGFSWAHVLEGGHIRRREDLAKVGFAGARQSGGCAARLSRRIKRGLDQQLSLELRAQGFQELHDLRALDSAVVEPKQEVRAGRARDGRDVQLKWI